MLLGWSVRCPRGVVPSGDTQGPMHILPMLWEIYLLLLWSQGPPQAGSPGALCSSTAQKDVAFGLVCIARSKEGWPGKWRAGMHPRWKGCV